MDRLSYQIYVTDALHAIAENTVIDANKFLEASEPVGKSMSLRWAERDKPAPPKDTRSAEEVIEHIRNKLARM